jgi:hypothetical protein
MIAPDESRRKGLVRGKSAAHTSGGEDPIGLGLSQERNTGRRRFSQGGHHSFVK